MDDIIIGQFARTKNEGCIVSVLDIRNGEALVCSTDGQVGYINLKSLQGITKEEMRKPLDETKISTNPQ